MWVTLIRKDQVGIIIIFLSLDLAIAAYHMAGDNEAAVHVFAILVNNAVAEERFSDAGYLHHLLAMQCLDRADTHDPRSVKWPTRN